MSDRKYFEIKGETHPNSPNQSANQGSLF